MMFLDTEEILKRTLFVIVVAGMIAGFGITYYYGRTLFLEVAQRKTETLALSDQTTQLNQETDGIKRNIANTNKDINKSINTNVEETKKVDSELKLQTTTVKQLQQELDKYKNETKLEINSLKTHNKELTDQLAIKDRQFNEQLKSRDTVFDKHKQETKIEISNLHNALIAKDKEITELKARLDKEISWRNKNYFNRY